MKLFNEHETYTKPYWEGGTVFGESFMPVYKKGESGEMVLGMMNTIDKIIEVRRADRSEVYSEGSDYILRDGKLVIPEGSRIHIMPWEEYCMPDSGDSVFECTLGGNLLFYNQNEYHGMQYEITYEPSDNCFAGSYIPEKSPLLSRTRELLASGKVLKLAFFGDSITYGMNASGLFGGKPPFMPVYPKLVAETLERRGHKIHYFNPSIGGISTWQGVQMAERDLGGFAPDLTVLAFGMNDACRTMNSPEELINAYIANLKFMIDTTRKANPNAEFILVTTTRPNPIAVRFNRLQTELEAPVCALAEREKCALLNMTELHRILLTKKEYHHMTGNNINHPCDFLARAYAQGVLSLIGE